jgi:hypothetical protein
VSAVVAIELVTNDDWSHATRAQLARLLAEYDLTPWMFTSGVAIDSRAIPHSHPVLTLHTRHLEHDDLLLATLLHEQLHWFLMTVPDSAAIRALDDLKRLFPSVPIAFPDGCQDEESTYLHLVVNYLEWLVLCSVVGSERARRIIEFWSQDHYRWVYRQVLEREADLRRVVVDGGLVPPAVAV